MANYQDPTQWNDFLAEFSQRNRGRYARFERFDSRSADEEEQEAEIENITAELDGDDAPRVIVTRMDRTMAEPQKIVTTITDVKRINSRFDTDNSEDGLEIEDRHNVLLILRMESRVDGAS